MPRGYITFSKYPFEVLEWHGAQSFALISAKGMLTIGKRGRILAHDRGLCLPPGDHVTESEETLKVIQPVYFSDR